MSSSDARCYDARYVDTTSIISSNITEDDLPGHGRVLGNVYSSLGRRLERLLSSLAERYDTGPNAVARRIRKTEGKRRWSDACTRKELERQREDIKRLVRYAKYAKRCRLPFIEAVCVDQRGRSKAESTRKQALEGILDCAWEGEYVLNLLKEAKITEVLQEQEAYIWDYCDVSLQTTSHMAYTCMQDGRALSLLKRYEADVNDLGIMEFIRYDISSVPRHMSLRS